MVKMRDFMLLCLIALTLSGCMSRTTSRMGDIFNDSAKDAGTRSGGG